MQTSRIRSVAIRCLVLVAAVLSVFAIAACESASTSVTGPSGNKCAITVKNNTSALPPSGGTGSITVSTSRDCAWSASTDASWIALGATKGQGSATVSYAAAVNPRGTPRRAGVVIAEQTLEIAQAAGRRLDIWHEAYSPAAHYHLTDAMRAVGRDPAEIIVGITAPAGCSWTVASDVSWITIADGRRGTGT